MQVGFNGILGLAQFRYDTDSTLLAAQYYTCARRGRGAAVTCIDIAPTANGPVTPSDQVQNPVFLLAQDNNGIIVRLNPISANGATSAGGSLILGIGTNAPINDPTALSGGTPIRTVGGTAFQIATDIDGNTMTFFLDTGTFADLLVPSAVPSLTLCSPPTFYCPTTEKTLTATVGPSTRSAPLTFKVANADTLLNSGNTAFNNLGADLGFFLWGLPVFYDKYVYMVYGPVNIGAISWSPPMWAYSGSSLPPPSITSLVPNRAAVGVAVRINGLYFGTQGSVTFGGRAVTPNSWSDTRIDVTVPTGLPLGRADVRVTANGGTTPPSTFSVVRFREPPDRDPPGR
jgi:hypothetical protein